MADSPARPEKRGYRNRTQGWLGVITINRKGDEVSIPVPPGDRVFLTDEEVTLTGQKHRDPSRSPFVSRHIVVRDIMTQEIIDEWDGPPLELEVEPDPAPAAVAPKAARRRRPAAKRPARAAAAA